MQITAPARVCVSRAHGETGAVVRVIKRGDAIPEAVQRI